MPSIYSETTSLWITVNRSQSLSVRSFKWNRCALCTSLSTKPCDVGRFRLTGEMVFNGVRAKGFWASLAQCEIERIAYQAPLHESAGHRWAQLPRSPGISNQCFEEKGDDKEKRIERKRNLIAMASNLNSMF